MATSLSKSIPHFNVIFATTPKKTHISFSPSNPSLSVKNSPLFSVNLKQPPIKFKASLIRTAMEKTTGLGFQLISGQCQHFHELPSGLKMEFIVQKGCKRDPSGENPQKPSLVFIHGSFHAAWCWAVNWMPFFSGVGHDCYALSLIGQGESDVPNSENTLQTHTRDVADFIRKEIQSAAVLLGHSFGGLVVQSYISDMVADKTEYLYPRLAGTVLICSVPPSGNSGLVMRYIFSRPIAAVKLQRYRFLMHYRLY